MSGIFGSIFESGVLPGLEQSVNFTAARHQKLLSNVANADTPGYRRSDLDVSKFQKMLEKSFEAQSSGFGASISRLDLNSRQLSSGSRGSFAFSAMGRGPLRHDGNDVAIEREMALLAQNAGKYSAYSALLRKGLRQLRAAITERPEEG